MPEPAGPTAQSGFLYQNSVSALFLGRLCDPTPRPPSDTVVEVRVEAPEDVDDTVVTFADDHKTYVHSKENIRETDVAWEKVWKDFESQFGDSTFRRGVDRLLLHTGEIRKEHHVLREMCKRAADAQSTEEWVNSFSKEQAKLLRNIQSCLSEPHAGEAAVFDLLRHIDVEIWGLEHIQRDVSTVWMPASSKPSSELFKLLRDTAAEGARYRRAFARGQLVEELRQRADLSFSSQPALADLRAAVRAKSAVLRQHKSSFGSTSVHIDQPVVADIINRVRDATVADNLGVILDQPGMGKSVIARDVLLQLDGTGIDVLAIKADQQLSNVKDSRDVSVGLPDSIDRVMARLGETSAGVLLIDQIDALSLSVARDQAALNAVLELLARVRLLPNVRVLLSCRTFDLQNDPRLRNIDISKRFRIAPLNDEDIQKVLDTFGVDFKTLTPATKQLLQIPLHLDLFSRVLGDRSRHALAREGYGVSSLQDLYSLLWTDVISKPLTEGPPINDRVKAIKLITDHMHREQTPSAPQSVWLEARLEEAANWLASEGIFLGLGTEWTFLHQTFFDYCYARFFVESGDSISQTILSGNQGLNARPQLLHVLSYLRSTNAQVYLRELHTILSASGLRTHLLDLTMRWFGGLSDPTDEELLLARRLFRTSALRVRLLHAMNGNVGWFNRLRASVIDGMLLQDEATLDTEVIPYLASMLDTAQSDVIQLVRPFLGRSDRWNQRVGWMLDRIRTWTSQEAVQLFEDWFRLSPTTERMTVRQFDDIAKLSPSAGCRLIRIVFDHLLSGIQQAQEASGNLYLHAITSDLEQLNGSPIVESLKIVTEKEPEYFLELMLPWLEQALQLNPPQPKQEFFYAGDLMSMHWYGTTYVVKHQLLNAYIDSLVALARIKPIEFRQIAATMASSEFETDQLLLSHVYRRVPDIYSWDALEFLVSDARRLYLGSDAQYDTRQVIIAIAPHLSPDELRRLEEVILAYKPLWKDWGIGGLKRYGVEQFRLLSSIPIASLSQQAQAKLEELRRKFPDEVIPQTPSESKGGWVGPPISDDAMKQMSDKAWLGAMGKYRRGVQHNDFLKGGAYELANALVHQVKDDPERFYRLAFSMPEETENAYVSAITSGLADSSAPLQQVVDVIRHFTQGGARDLRGTISSALQKRADEIIPDDLIDLLEGYARGPFEESNEDSWKRDAQQFGKIDQYDGWNRGPYTSYLNSPRGTAFRSVMRALDRKGDEESRKRKWSLIEFAATDPSSALRAGAIEEMSYMLHQDRERAISLFEKLLEGHPALIRASSTHEFIRAGIFRFFTRMKPFIMQLMRDDRYEGVRQRGAELICIASISTKGLDQEELTDARQLAETTVTGPAEFRRGAAGVYAANVGTGTMEYCEERLKLLLDDDDQTVRQLVGGMFPHLRDEHIFTLRDLLEAFASSSSLGADFNQFTEYLWTHAAIDPEWALKIVELVLQNPNQPAGFESYGRGEELIRLVLRVYTDPLANDSLRREAMDLFDRLMDRYTFDAYNILKEWDLR
jgi:hypothetical protein